MSLETKIKRPENGIDNMLIIKPQTTEYKIVKYQICEKCEPLENVKQIYESKCSMEKSLVH